MTAIRRRRACSASTESPDPRADPRDATALDSVLESVANDSLLQDTRYIPVTRWNRYHEWPPPGGLRHLIFYADTNGFATAFKRVGRRVLVGEAEFFRCVESNNRRAG